jgi:heptosyltransferase-2
MNKVLIIAAAFVGDTVMAQTLFKIIKQQDPTCSIDVLAATELHHLLKHMPEVDNCLTNTIKRHRLQLFNRFKLAKEISKKTYTHVYIMPTSFKSAIIPFLANIPIRTGQPGELRHILLNNIILGAGNKETMISRLAELGKTTANQLPTILPLPKLHLSKKQLEETLNKLKINIPQKPILAICPGSASGTTKCWPTTHFATVAKTLKNAGWEVWILGGPSEVVAAQEIQTYSNNICLDLTNKTNLSDAVALLSLAKVTVANDSGLMHIASALDKAVVAIYGSTPPKFAPPLTNSGKSLSLNLACSPCKKPKCKFQHIKCLQDLRPELVLQAINELVSIDI